VQRAGDGDGVAGAADNEQRVLVAVHVKPLHGEASQ
jgi:hypothetical protein